MNKSLIFTLVSVTFLILVLGIITISPETEGGDYDTNDTALAVVNITNSAPTLSSFVFEDDTLDDPFEIDLRAGNLTTVFCNYTVTDENGYEDINGTNATIFFPAVNATDDVDNDNAHYTNTTCRQVASTTTSIDYECSFQVQYYALNGTWLCNASAWDQTVAGSYNVSYNSTAANITPLLALNVTEILDFGELSVGENSTEDVNGTVMNLGNVLLDLNLYGYAINPSDNATFVCTRGNITQGWLKYNITQDARAFTTEMEPLVVENITGVTHPEFNLTYKRHGGTDSTDVTRWKVGIPAQGGIRGECNGTVVFAAVAS